MDEIKTFDDLKNLDANALIIWQKAIDQLSHLSDDVWNGVRFYWTLNGIVLTLMLAVYQLFDDMLPKLIAISLLLAIGSIFAIHSYVIFVKQRRNYVEMLLYITLLEMKLGFYKISLLESQLEDHTVLSFPWKVPLMYIDGLKSHPVNWKKKQLWRTTTISRHLRIINISFLLLYLLLICILLIGLAIHFRILQLFQEIF